MLEEGKFFLLSGYIFVAPINDYSGQLCKLLSYGFTNNIFIFVFYNVWFSCGLVCGQLELLF